MAEKGKRKTVRRVGQRCTRSDREREGRKKLEGKKKSRGEDVRERRREESKELKQVIFW